MNKRESSTATRRVLRRPGLALALATFIILVNLQFLYFPSQLFEPRPRLLEAQEHSSRALQEGLCKCASNKLRPVQYDVPPSPKRTNPRWNSKSGQSTPILIANASVFDGASFVKEPLDIFFRNGIITSVEPAAVGIPNLPEDVEIINAGGRYVTPGLVDMHSHHLSSAWPMLAVSDDANEVNKETGPLTPMVRVLDSMKAYDPAKTLIASGGVTSSLILPGSANIMGGEAYPVKNVFRDGQDGEEVVEDLLLEHGIPHLDRRRYMKMACGENPSGVYDHTRMGNAWKLREQMAKGKDMKAKQDDWCLSAAAAKEAGDAILLGELVKSGYPEELALDSTVAMLRGQVNVNIHCYEQQDFEDMLRHNEEFNFSIAAFHHALEAWKVPELIKSSGLNITIATFQDFALYKHEAYDASLRAGKILAEHGLPVAYKSDHSGEFTYAKYLLFQAAGAHSFGLPADLALQAVTSVPARSIKQDHRIGSIKPGYDADIVLWDSHPLTVGATPAAVFIDGKSALPESKHAGFSTIVKHSPSLNNKVPQMRPAVKTTERDAICRDIKASQSRLVVTGINKSFLEPNTSSDRIPSAVVESGMTMILESGKITCVGSSEECIHDESADTVLALKDGHVLPGLTAVNTGLGLREIEAEDVTSDGVFMGSKNLLDPSSVVYAKYGIHLEGKGFRRASIGGVTRAVTSPLSSGSLLRGVSVGIKTTGNKTILDGGIFQDDVALHFVVGQNAKGSKEKTTISEGIAKLRRVLSENEGKDSVYGKAADGKLPVIVHAKNKYDIMQLIRVKRDHKQANLIIMHGHEAPAVAKELADAEIPLIFTAHRGAPEQWEQKDVLPGPPLSRSSVSVLVENNVKFAISVSGDAPVGASFIHNLLLEASWAAKYADLSDKQAVDLVSKNVEDILGLERTSDTVIYEGNPLEFGASVVLALDGHGNVDECWPDSI